MTKKRRVQKGPPPQYANRTPPKQIQMRFMLAAEDDPYTMLGTAGNIFYALDGAWMLHKKTGKPIVVFDTETSTERIARVAVQFFEAVPPVTQEELGEDDDGKELGTEPESEPVGEAEGVHQEEQEAGNEG